MFKAIHHTEAARTFSTYAEAYHFVTREGDRSKLWQIVAGAPHLVEDCRAERDAFLANR